jgi:hypothetical protein
MAVAEGDREVTHTFSLGGGKVRLSGSIELLIPGEAVEAPTNFTLGFNEGKTMLKVTPYRGQIGDVYRIGWDRPEHNAQILASASGPFVLRIPFPKGKKEANLVVGVSADGKLGKYTVLAPKSMEEGANGPVGVFELTKFPAQAIIHLTSSPPTGGE